MRDVSGKRLLILGGQLKMLDIVKRAREMGVYTVVTDWYEDSPAKALADKAFDISIADHETILSLIREERIDGVFTGFIDSYLPHYYEICRKAGFPCYLNQEILACSTDKRQFKTVCRSMGIQTVPDVDISDLAAVRYPIVMKPVDNSGSKGITICCDENMLAPAIERAKRFSKSKRYLVEPLMVCDYIAAYYTVRNGAAKLSLLMDKDTNRVGRGKISYPVAYVSPSRYRDKYVRKVQPLIEKLIARLGMQNGTFLISFFVSGMDFYAVEMAARLTATREYIITGEDILGKYIHYALTGIFEGEGRDHYENDGGITCMLLHFINEGTIGKIEGIEEVKKMNGLLDVLQYRNVGAKIRADGSYGQLFCRIYLRGDTAEEIIDTVEDVQRSFQVYSTDHRPMLFTGFDARSFFNG